VSFIWRPICWVIATISSNVFFMYHSDLPRITASSAYARHCLVLLYIVPPGLILTSDICIQTFNTVVFVPHPSNHYNANWCILHSAWNITTVPNLVFFISPILYILWF
jgi:hypothetical protein